MGGWSAIRFVSRLPIQIRLRPPGQPGIRRARSWYSGELYVSRVYADVRDGRDAPPSILFAWRAACVRSRTVPILEVATGSLPQYRQSKVLLWEIRQLLRRRAARGSSDRFGVLGVLFCGARRQTRSARSKSDCAKRVRRQTRALSSRTTREESYLQSPRLKGIGWWKTKTAALKKQTPPVAGFVCRSS